MPDPGQLAASLLQKHFPKSGSFRTLCDYLSVADSDYDSDSGVVTPVIDLTQTDVYFIFDDFSYTQTKAAEQKHDDVSILSIDKNAIIPSLDLDVVPKAGDILKTSSGLFWEAVAIGKDPKPAHYELHVRPLEYEED